MIPVLKETVPKLGVHTNIKSSCESKRGCNCRSSRLKVSCISEEAVWFIKQMAQEGVRRESLGLVKSQKSD